MGVRVAAGGVIGLAVLGLARAASAQPQTPGPQAVPFHVICDSGCGSPPANPDTSPFTAGGTNVSLIAAVFDDTMAALTAGKYGAPRITRFRAMHFNLRDNDGNEVGLSAAPLFVNCVNCGGSTAVLIADGAANPTVPQTAAFGMVYNGLTWDRHRGDIAGGAWVTIKNGSIAVTGTFWPTAAGSPSSTRLSDGGSFYDARLIRLLTSSDVVDISDRSGRALGSIANTAFQANAGTNLNTSALALEAGGNLAAIKTDVDKIPASPSTAGKQDTGNVSLASIDVKLTNPLPVSFTRLNSATDSVTIIAGTVTQTDLEQIRGFTVARNTGAVDDGTQRMVLADNQPPVSVAGAAGAALALEGTQLTGNVSLASIDVKITTLQTKLDTLDADFRNQQATQSVNWYGGWPVKTQRPGVPLFAADPVSSVWVSGFGAQNGLQFGPGPSGPNTVRVAEANDVVNTATGTITSAASVIGPMSLDGAAGVECFIGAGFTGTLLFQYGPDAAGAYGWNTATTQFAGGTTALPSFTGAAATVNPLLGQGARFLKVSVLIYTSGQAPAICLATKIMSPLAIPGLTIAVPAAAVPALAMETHDITREPKVCTFGYGASAASPLGTTLSLCMAAPGAGLRNYIVDVEFISTTATASTVQFKSGTQVTTPCDTGAQNISVAYATPISTATPTRFSFQLGDGSTPLNQQICVVGGSATNTTALKVTGFVSR